jgi:predicted ATPase/DNA-binding CsgD family transcriptional regulator
MRDHVQVDPAAISPREAEVLAALGKRLSNAQIAHRLNISVRTVESHVSSLLRKLGAADRAGLAELAGPVPLGPAVAPAGRVTGIPGSHTTFVGRSRDRDAVLDRLTQARLVTLLGPGGVGKTRLAAVLAEAAAPGYPSGGTFVDLVPVRPGFFVAALAGVLNVVERPPRSLMDAVTERIGAGRSLIVLDNCEHLVDEVGPVVERLLADCPGTTILTTSRQRLGVTGEHLMLVAPLPLDSDAERLFLDRARVVAPGFAADPSLVTQICARLDGMPLAIELAAARSASLGADGLVAALDDHLRLLTGGRQPDERHRSLRQVIQWSHDLLDAAEQAAFRRLSVFVGGFDLVAGQAIMPEASRGEVADLIGRLVDKSLVDHRGDRGRSRWRMLDTVRAFGERQLTTVDDVGEVRRRYLAWAAATAEALEQTIPSGGGPSFDEVADDLRAALAGTDPAPDATAHRLARSLARLTFGRGFFVEACEHYRAAADRAGDAVEATQDLRHAADAAVIVSEGRAAFELLLDAADRAGRGPAGSGNARAAALAHALIVSVRYPGLGGGMTEEDRSGLLRNAIAAADGDDPTTAATLAAARAWHRVDDPATAVGLARDAVRAARQTGDPALIALSLDALGIAVIQAGHPLEAHHIAEERIEIVSSLSAGDPSGAAEITDAHHVAASAAVAAGDLPAARHAVQRASVDDPIADHPYLSRPKLVRVLALSGQFDEATETAQFLWDSWVRDGQPPMPWMASAIAAAALGHGLRSDGQYEVWRSRAYIVAGTDAPTRWGELGAIMAFVEARIAIHSAGVDRADALVERGFAAFRERWWEGYARAAGAELAVVAGLPDAAGKLAQLAPLATEHRWAAACLARARGRLTGDAAAIIEALAEWDRLGARFERACTLLLLPDREKEGRAELSALGCPHEAQVRHR